MWRLKSTPMPTARMMMTNDGEHGAELDAEQLANNAGSDEAEKEKK